MSRYQELHDKINFVSCPTEEIREICNILDRIVLELGGLEARLRKAEENANVAERAAARANYIAGCLANGITPD